MHLKDLFDDDDDVDPVESPSGEVKSAETPLPGVDQGEKRQQDVAVGPLGEKEEDKDSEQEMCWQGKLLHMIRTYFPLTPPPTYHPVLFDSGFDSDEEHDNIGKVCTKSPAIPLYVCRLKLLDQEFQGRPKPGVIEACEASAQYACRHVEQQLQRLGLVSANQVFAYPMSRPQESSILKLKQKDGHTSSSARAAASASSVPCASAHSSSSSLLRAPVVVQKNSTIVASIQGHSPASDSVLLASPSTTSYITRMYELAQSKSNMWNIACEYTKTATGGFLCFFTIANLGKSFVGEEAKTKKAAKESAAQRAWQELKPESFSSVDQASTCTGRSVEEKRVEAVVENRVASSIPITPRSAASSSTENVNGAIIPPPEPSAGSKSDALSSVPIPTSAAAAPPPPGASSLSSMQAMAQMMAQMQRQMQQMTQMMKAYGVEPSSLDPSIL